ncbi:MAG: hypothetical protein COA79_04105 [Planctomycetota bacterium]|nr:MAG: hypothetical protein COA79_04105 [Planctomycetota bacterium]
MPAELLKTSILILGAEYFQLPIEDIKLHLIQNSLFYDTYIMSAQTDPVFIKIAHPYICESKLLSQYSLATEAYTRQLLNSKTKLKLPSLIEFNKSHDLLPNDYMILESISSTYLPENFQPNQEFKSDIDLYLEKCYQVSNSTFGNFQEENQFKNWENFFEFRWNLLLNELTTLDIFDQEEIEFAETFFQSLQEVLEEESSPVLTNLGLANHQFSHQNKILDCINDFSQCLWATPEFELAKRDFLKSIETPQLLSYKQSIKDDITTKAKYFLYLVYFLCEDCLIQHSLGHSLTHYQNNKILGLTLMKSALQQ